MSFTVPEMPLAVHVWTSSLGPPLAPRLITTGNLAYGRRVTVAANLGFDDSFSDVYAYLLVPAGVDIRDAFCVAVPDLLEVPAGTGRYYYATFVDDLGKGFPNEHRFVLLTKTGDFGAWPTPIP